MRVPSSPIFVAALCAALLAGACVSGGRMADRPVCPESCADKACPTGKCTKCLPGFKLLPSKLVSGGAKGAAHPPPRARKALAPRPGLLSLGARGAVCTCPGVLVPERRP